MVESVYRIGFDSRSAEQRARAFRKELELTERNTGKLDNQTRVLGASFRSLSGVLAGYAGIAGFRKIISDVSMLEQINARIANLTGDLASEQAFLRGTARELSTEYVNLANAYSKLLPLQKAGILSSKENRDITKGLANAQAATGASAVQLGQTMFGLAQGLTAGTLRAEELNQVTEPMPGLLQALDRASGQAAGGFRKLVVAGEVTSQVFKDTLLVALEDYEGSAAALSGNIRQSFTRVQNEYTNLIDALAVPINSALVPFANALESVLTNVSENSDDYIATLGFVAQASAVAFGARVLGELTAYGAQLGRNAAAALQSARANVVLAKSNAAESASKVRQAAAAADYAAIQLRETQQRALSITGIRRLTFVTTELAAAERAAALATANLAAASAGATGTTNALAAAQARASVTALALAGAQGLASSAMALVGGPVGVALLAAYGVYKFVDSLEDQESAANKSTISLNEIAESYKRTGDSAEDAARQTIKLAEAELLAARAELEAARVRDQQGVGRARDLGPGQRTSSVVSGEVQALEEAIREARERVTEESYRLGQEAMAAAVAGAKESASPAGLRTAADQLIAGLFPSDAKIAKLQNQLAEVRDLASKGFISDEDSRRAQAAITKRIASLDGSTEAARNTKDAIRDLADATKDYHDIIGGFNPNFAAQFAYEDTVSQLKEALRLGAISATEFAGTLAELDVALSREFIDNRIAKERELQDILSNSDTDNTAIRDYEDSILLLNRALEDTPEKAEQVQAAIARLNQDFLSGGTQRSPTEDIQAQFDERLRVLQQYKESEQANIEGANQAILASEYKRYAELRNVEASQNSERLSQSQRFTNDLIRQNESDSEFRRDAAIRAGTGVEHAEAAHQERLAAIREFGFDVEALKRQYEAGEISLAEYHARIEQLESDHQGRLVGIKSGSGLAQFDKEIQLGNQLFDLYEQGLSRRSDRALQAAKDARELADNATGAEKEALEEQAIQAEAYARRRFEKEKKAGIAQARVQQALAVVKAWTSGATIYDQIINAGIAFAGTEAVIQDLKSQQFNGGSPIAGGSGGGGSSGGGGNSSAGGINNDQGQTQPNYVFNIFHDDRLIDRERLKEEYGQMTKEFIESNELTIEGGEIQANIL